MSSRPAQGRPLGFLALWLEEAHNFGSRKDHLGFRPPQAQRAAARERLKAAPGYAAFIEIAKERERREGPPQEPEEPEDCPR